MQLTNSYKQRRFYWTIQSVLIGPVILMWCGVAYWFGFASEVILGTVFPRSLAPLVFSTLLIAAFCWTLRHRRHVPRREQHIRRMDTAILIFIAASTLLVFGQIRAM